MFQSVKINDNDMYSTFGCILANKTIGQPSAKTKYVDVPLRDGSIDLTEELTSSIKYENRSIEMSFLYLGDDKANTIMAISRAFNGKKVKIQFDDDPSFYYMGRIQISEQRKNNAMTIKMTAECDPFKYDVNVSDQRWAWDTFSFDYGVINEASGIEVDGEKDFSLYCIRDREFPIFTSSDPMTMTFKGVMYSLKAGSQKLYGVFFEEGENKLKFNGYGTVTITYRGGSL